MNLVQKKPCEENISKLAKGKVSETIRLKTFNVYTSRVRNYLKPAYTSGNKQIDSAHLYTLLKLGTKFVNIVHVS